MRVDPAARAQAIAATPGAAEADRQMHEALPARRSS
jgi:hypothetical protein